MPGSAAAGVDGLCRLAAYLEELEAAELKKFKLHLAGAAAEAGERAIPRGRLEAAGPLELAQLLEAHCGPRAAWLRALRVFERIHRRDLWERARGEDPAADAPPGDPCPLGGRPACPLDAFAETPRKDPREIYRDHVRRTFRLMQDRNARLGESVNLGRRYTRLQLVQEHPTPRGAQRRLRGAGARPAGPARVDALFEPDAERPEPPRAVVVQGAAGMGKSMLARKATLDWADGRLFAGRFDYLFFVSCRELGRGGPPLSAADLLAGCWPEPGRAPLAELLRAPERLLLVIDGFDELQPSSSSSSSDPGGDPPRGPCRGSWEEKRSPEQLLAGLLAGRLLPAASLLVTTRPCALERLQRLLEHPRRVEVLGFSAAGRREFFRRFFGDAARARRALALVRGRAPLLALCFVPLVCWVVCTCLRQQLEAGGGGGRRGPAARTATAVYLLYLLSLLQPRPGAPAAPAAAAPLARPGLCSLAAEGVWSRRVLFDERDLRRHGLDGGGADVSSFLNVALFQRDLHCERLYSFIHLSFQEFFAAVHYALDGGADSQDGLQGAHRLEGAHGLQGAHGLDGADGLQGAHGLDDGTDGLQGAHCLDGAHRLEGTHGLDDGADSLQGAHGLDGADNGAHRLDGAHRGRARLLAEYALSERSALALPVRFLFGLLHREAAGRLERALGWRVAPGVRAELLAWVRARARGGAATLQQGARELLGCLYETQEEDFVRSALSPFQVVVVGDLASGVEHAAAAFCLRLCANALVLHLHGAAYRAEEEEEEEEDEEEEEEDEEEEEEEEGAAGPQAHPAPSPERNVLPDAYSEHLAEALSTNPNLIELALCRSALGGRGVRLLCRGLRHPNCKLQNLRLKRCRVPGAACGDLAATLAANRHLMRLDLSGNALGEAGLRLLCGGLRHPQCRLQVLQLRKCELEAGAGGELASVLSSGGALAELDLTGNALGDAGLRLLCGGLRHPRCRLRILWLKICHLTAEACGDLASALPAAQSLAELDLSLNDLGDPGVQLLAEGLGHPQCRLQTLRLSICRLGAAACEGLASALQRNRQLRELDLSFNDLGDQGAWWLCEGLQHPACRLQKLWLDSCGLTAAACGDLSATLGINQTLTELYLTNNTLGSAGVRRLCRRLRHPGCKLRVLWLFGVPLSAATHRELTALRWTRPSLDLGC